MINQAISVKISNIFYEGGDLFNKICDSFHNQQIGRVFSITTSRLPFNKKYGHPMYTIFVYFSVWYDTAAAENIQSRIIAKKKCKFTYDAPEPCFWLLAENKSRKLSKIELQMLKNDTEYYHNELAAQMQEQDAEDVYISQLFKQNEMIQRLQNICIQNGLDLPFWDAKNPPAVEDTAYELSAAQTALECSAALFADEETDEETDALAHECVESVLEEEDIWTKDFIPVPYYENEWKYDNPFPIHPSGLSMYLESNEEELFCGEC